MNWRRFNKVKKKIRFLQGKILTKLSKYYLLCLTPILFEQFYELNRVEKPFNIIISFVTKPIIKRKSKN